MMNIGDPERAFELARLPNDGVGLARMEFVFAGWVGIHPLALTRFETLPPNTKLEVARRTRGYEDKTAFFVDRLAQGIGTLAADFAALFDDYSNDLTQLVLGVDRDSEQVAPLFDGRDEAVKRMCAALIEEAHRAGRKVGICGQAPTDYPDFAAFLVERGIDSISLSPDAVVPTTLIIAEAEIEMDGSKEAEE